jgi:hypothetical protein
MPIFARGMAMTLLQRLLGGFGRADDSTRTRVPRGWFLLGLVLASWIILGLLWLFVTTVMGFID